MQIIYINFLLVFVFIDLYAEKSAASVTQTFTYSGGIIPYTIPSDVYEITVTGCGATGTSSSHNNQAGGSGGCIQATLSVTPGEILSYNVGGTESARPTGGYNGGGTGGVNPSSPSYKGGGGGGATTLVNSFGVTLLAAGGGGGGIPGIYIVYIYICIYAYACLHIYNLLCYLLILYI